MSLYPQSQAYGQLPYPPPGFSHPHPVPPPYPFTPPPPPQPVYYDPNMFRREYSARLAELTVNSRPIIQGLSMMAHEYARFSDVVVQCIESHIRRVQPWMKLPSFYLLDAISKNVFDPYARQFTSVVVRLFLDTYEVVDASTRSKMEEMLLTWRTGAPNGRELFGVVNQIAIERQIWGEGSNVASSSRNPTGRPSISTAQVLSELEFVLGYKERELRTNPYDKGIQQSVSILHQLRKVVSAGVSQEELGQILTQLRALAPQPPPTAHVPPPASLPPPHAYLHPPPPPPAVMPNYAAPPPPAQFPPFPPTSFPPPKSQPVDLSSIIPTQTVATTSNAASSSAPPIGNFNGLFDALLKAGVVSAAGTPSAAASTSKAGTPQPVDAAKDSASAYRRAILSNKVNLSSADIIKQTPVINLFLYDQLPIQCKQCGIRFADTALGKKRMEEHLDMHFRQNRKAGQASGRGHSRGWFIGVEDWIYDSSTDVKGKGRADGSRPLNAKAAAAAEAAKLDAELRAMFVVVPPGDEAKAISCPICKEPLKSEFLEDDEDWVWKNAILKDDKIFHATCHAEAAASKSKSSLAARLRNEASTVRSRSRTPESAANRGSPPKGFVKKLDSPSPSRLAGSKRKAEDDNTSASIARGETTPPMKKLALAMS